MITAETTSLPNTYNVINYKDVNDFIDKTASILEQDEIINTFPLWIANRQATRPSSQAPQSYAALFRNDQLVFAYVCAEGSSYVGWCRRNQGDPESRSPGLVGAIMELFNTSVPLAQITSIQGYSPVADLFYDIRKTMEPALTHQETLNKHTWSHQITHKQEIQWTERTRRLDKRAQFRQAEWMDFPLLLKWLEAFSKDCGISDGDMWDLCATDIKDRTAYFWCLDDMIPRAMVFKRRALRHGISLGYVYTPDEYRGQGYAAAMVARFTESLLEDDGFSYVTLLVAGTRDPHMNLYTSVGYQLVGSMNRFCY